MVLRFEHVQNVRAERLSRLDHVGACRVALAGNGELRRRAMNGDAVFNQRVDELRGGQEIRLIGGNDVAPRIPQHRIAQGVVVSGWNCSASAGRHAVLRDLRFHAGHAARRVCPRVAVSALDRIHTHAVNTEEKPILISRCVIKDGAVCRDRIVDRLPEMPPRLRGNRVRQIVFRKRLLRHKWNLDGRGAAHRFRQQADLVMEIRTGA